MKKTVKVLCLAVLMIGSAFSASAQFRQSIFFNVNAPTGDFASQVTPMDNRPILAMPVPTQNVPLGYSEIGKNASIGFGLGSLSSEYRSARADATPTYINVPVQLGVSYLYDQLWNDITPYAEFGIGVDGMFITSEGPCHWTTLTGSTVNSAKYSYDPSFAVAFSFGLGAYFGRHVSAGLYYYGLGQHTINYTKKTIDEGLTDIPLASQRNYFLANPTSRSVGSFALRIGFHF